MSMPKFIPSLFIFICIEIISFQLLLDPWAQERFTRICRENTRLYNPLLNHIPRINEFREIIAAIGIISAPLFLLGSKFFGQLSILGITIFSLINFGPLIIFSDRFQFAAIPGLIGSQAIAFAIYKLVN